MRGTGRRIEGKVRINQRPRFTIPGGLVGDHGQDVSPKTPKYTREANIRTDLNIVILVNTSVY